MLIKGEKINLRQLRKTDDQSIFKNANDREICRYTVIPYPYTLKMAQSFIRETAKKIKAGTSYDFGVVDKDSNKVIGAAALRIRDKKAKVAEIGYWAGRKYWGKGIASEATALIIDFGFKKLKLNRIYGQVMKPNSASARVLEKNGFKPEGVLRRHEYKMGKIHDVLLFGLLKEEYKKK